MVLDDLGPCPSFTSRAADMSSAAVSTANNGTPTAPAPAASSDDSATTITVSTKVMGSFPPPKTDKPRPHVCATCLRCFARLEHLRRHERSHTKEKPFECPECTRCFARRDLLLRHQQKLHQTSTPSSRPRNRRESAGGVTPAQSRRKNSVTGVNPAGSGSGSTTTSMRPRANTISHVDGAAMQLLAATSTASSARQMAHSRHASLIGLPTHNLDHVFGGMSAVMGQRGLQHGLPKLETFQMGSGDLDSSGLRTAPPMAIYNPEVGIEDLIFGSTSTINPNALHYNDSPQSMALDQTSPFFGPALSDLSATQHLDDALEWLPGFDHRMSFHTNENVIDGSSPSAISTTSQSGISDFMVDGSNHPAPAGINPMWQPSAMGPPQLSNPFAMEMNGSVFPDLLIGAPMSPQPASQKSSDPYFSAHPTSLSSVSPSVISEMNRHQNVQNLIPGLHAVPEVPSSLNPNGANHVTFSPVTTITDETRTAIVTILSRCLPFSSRKHSSSSPSQDSPLSPWAQVSSSTTANANANANTNANTANINTTTTTTTSSPSSPSSSSPSALHPHMNVPSTQDLQRYVKAYLTCLHPHIPFLHLPTLSFSVSSDFLVFSSDASGNGCLLLSMAAFGAAYESEHARSRELFEMARKIILFYLDDRRNQDARRADMRLNTTATVTDTDAHRSQSPPRTPLWLVQTMLLNVMYGHTCSDKMTSDNASANLYVLVGLCQSAGLMKQDKAGGASAHDEQEKWIEWKSMEEQKRTVYAVFILSSLAVASFNHCPALTNSEISLDLPCDEEFFEAESSADFAAKGGAEAASRNKLTFCDSLGELLCANERHRKQGIHGRQHKLEPPSGIKPSTFGCLVLIYALQNYIWETRQRHQNRAWTDMETEKMYGHIGPALEAWRRAWSSDPQHSVERPNPYGRGPMSADAILLLHVAHVKLSVDFGPAKKKLWQRDWEGMLDELSRHDEARQEARSPPPPCASDFGSDSSSSAVLNVGFMESPTAQSYASAAMADDFGGPRSISSRESCLRTASCYAVELVALFDAVSFSGADGPSHMLPMQTALCTAECGQTIAAWLTALQERVGLHVGIVGQDAVDFGQVPAIMVLDAEDMKLLRKVEDVLALAEVRMGMRLGVASSGPGDVMGDVMGAASVLSPDGFNGYAARILRLTAWLVKSSVWPVAQVAAYGLERYANHVRAQAEKSVVI